MLCESYVLFIYSRTERVACERNRRNRVRKRSVRLMGCACGRTHADALDTRVHATSAFGRARPGAAYVRPGCSGTAGECGASDWVESRGRLGCSSSDTQSYPPARPSAARLTRAAWAPPTAAIASHATRSSATRVRANGEFDSTEGRLSAGARGRAAVSIACARVRTRGDRAAQQARRMLTKQRWSALVCTAVPRIIPAAGPGRPLVSARCALDRGLAGCAHRVVSD